MSESKTPHGPGCWEDPEHGECARIQARAAINHIHEQQKEIASLIVERDALAARVAEAEKDAGRWRFVRSKVSRILNERTLKMDGLRVEVYYDEPQPFVILPTDNGALFDEAIDAALSREEES